MTYIATASSTATPTGPTLATATPIATLWRENGREEEEKEEEEEHHHQ
jgi:hypothetical protein